MILADNVSKVYETMGGPLLAVDRFSLEMPEGEFVSIVGPSGCGKTTMLKMLAGIMQPTSGDLRVAGQVVDRPRTDIGIVFQGAVLLPWRTAMDNALLPIELRGRPTQQDKERALMLLEKVKLKGFEDRYPFELSGGMQQRVAICRGLISDPSILLLDEPFGALDALTREELNVQLNEIWRQTNKTALLITHSIPEAVFLSQRVVVMGPRPGRILDIIDIDFPRERNLDILATAKFAEITGRIRKYFKQ